MQANQITNNTGRSQAMASLIEQQYQLVIQGKSPQALVNLLHDYQMNPFTANIKQSPKLIGQYVVALLLNGDYIHLSLLLTQYTQKDVQITNRALLQKIVQAGKREDLKQLGSAIQNYISSFTEAEQKMKTRVRSATIANILTILAKYFINFSFRDIQTIFKMSENDVIENGHNLKQGFIILTKQQQRRVDCLQDKLKQLAVVSNKMSLLQ